MITMLRISRNERKCVHEEESSICCTEPKEDSGKTTRIALEEIVYLSLRDLDLQLQLHLQQLKLQFYFCFIGIVLTVIAFASVDRSECCALPFEKSACGPRNVSAHFVTNHSTLVGEVDEFEAAIDGWFLFVPFVFFGAMYNGVIGIALRSTTRPTQRHMAVLRNSSEEERENLQNSRIRKLKRRIPIFYLATLICILIEFGLYATFMAGQYYAGSCATYIFIQQTRVDKLRKRQTYLPKSFTNYTTFTDELQSTLDGHIKNLNTTMQYSELESRQLSWHYEYEAIKPALTHYVGLKKYHVNRKTMPRHISRVTPRAVTCVVSAICLFFNFVFLQHWAAQEGSVWRPSQFMEYF
ncbi:hypothetical protein DdX_11280 [Ditylenchus destructor]|uniref:Uncharacterized protein n=1 Tax=Ditylenchus destructor TaxID=166010 RepID=A0AAD4R4Q6_9BILA|nr:hypothetical protein DdX_11280 [Ditylenchus destructor]